VCDVCVYELLGLFVCACVSEACVLCVFLLCLFVCVSICVVVSLFCPSM